MFLFQKRMIRRPGKIVYIPPDLSMPTSGILFITSGLKFSITLFISNQKNKVKTESES